MLTKVYTDAAGPSYLAGYVGFITENIRNPYVFRLVYGEFLRFLRDIVKAYQRPPGTEICFSGSIAYHFAEILRMAGNDEGLVIGKIIKDPIAALALYHQKYDL